MKNLSDFKRALIEGSIWYSRHAMEKDFKKRVVEYRSLVSYVKFDDGSRLHFPSASEFEINAQGEAEIYWPATYRYEGVERVEIPRKLILTYKKG